MLSFDVAFEVLRYSNFVDLEDAHVNAIFTNAYNLSHDNIVEAQYYWWVLRVAHRYTRHLLALLIFDLLSGEHTHT